MDDAATIVSCPIRRGSLFIYEPPLHVKKHSVLCQRRGPATGCIVMIEPTRSRRKSGWHDLLGPARRFSPWWAQIFFENRGIKLSKMGCFKFLGETPLGVRNMSPSLSERKISLGHRPSPKGPQRAPILPKRYSTNRHYRSPRIPQKQFKEARPGILNSQETLSNLI